MRLRKQLILLLPAVMLLLGGCIGQPAVLDTRSIISAAKADLFRLSLVMGFAVWLLVTGILLFVIGRYRRRAGDNEEPRQIHHNVTLEAIWTAIPVLLVIFLFIATINTMRAVAAPPASASDINVRVVGHRWWWEFQYPDLGITTANELHIPAGAKVQVTLESADVVHSFWPPQLTGKIDAVPGQVNHLWLTSDQPGTYLGQCAEFCGTQHAYMLFRVIVDDQAAWDTWVQGQQQPVQAAQSELEKRGETIVTTGLCIGCHTVAGTNAKGLVGPNLTHLASRTTFAGASIPLTDENLAAWLRNPNDLKPGNLMANIHTPEQDIDAVVAYLKTLK